MTYYERNLPHYHPENSILFITFRLVNTLSSEVLSEMRLQYESERNKLITIYSDIEIYKAKLYNLQKNFLQYMTGI